MNPQKRKNGGFTLVEMLVVIAIIAILVAIIIPAVSSATTKAKAATDAANLRSLLGQANVLLVDDGINAVKEYAKDKDIECKTVSGAKAVIVYEEPAFLDAYFYAEDDGYYDLKYFQELAESGSTSLAAVELDTEIMTIVTIGSKSDETD